MSETTPRRSDPDSDIELRTIVRSELSVLGKLAAPMVASQVAMLTMGIVDTAMVGRLGAHALAAVALGDLWTFGTLMIAQGVIMGIDPVVTHAHGRGDGATSGLALQRALVLSVLIAIPVALLWYLAEPGLILFGQDRALAADAGRYSRAQVFGIIPFLAFVALRHYLQGREKMFAPLAAILIANVGNVVFNWALIYGNLGCPALGIRGAAIATGLSRTLLVAALAIWVVVRGLHRDAWVPWSRAAFDPAGLRSILGYGIPIGVQFGLEIWAFNAAGMLAGGLGTVPLAAHIIVLRIASLSFMMPVGISIAAATRVGNLIGADRRRRAQKAAFIALGAGGAVMLLAAVAFIVFRYSLPRVFTVDAPVIALAAATLPIAAAFQLFDGVQCVGAGILRGIGTTRPAAMINLVGFYVFALPFSWALAYPLGLGLAGIWWGLAVGLGVVAVLLAAWVTWRGPAYLAGESPPR